MSTRYAFSQNDLEQFEQISGQRLDLTKEQFDMLEDKAATTLTTQQLRRISENLAGELSIHDFVADLTSRFQPLSMSLFVFNDLLWKLMEKKEDSIDTMYPIVSIPRFYWKESAINPKNPFGVQREPTSNLSLTIEPHKSIVLNGLGGEFCGIVEGQLVGRKIEAKPILAPTLPGMKEKVPKYDIQNIEVRLSVGNLRTNLYPRPSKAIDYTFSEHPKVFYEHGLSVLSEGSQVQLRIGNGRAHPLHGEVILLLGRRLEPETPGHDIISYHAWLNAFAGLLE